MPDFHLTAQQWRNVVAHSPEMIAIVDVCGDIQYINYTSPNYTREQVLGTSIYAFVSGGFHETIKSCHERVLATGVPESYAGEHLAPDGASYWYSVRVGRLVLEDQEDALILCIRDITEIKKGQDALSQQRIILSAVIESMADGVAVVDEHGEFLVYNVAAEEIVGLGPHAESRDDWTGYFGLYRADKTTPFPEEELPLRLAAQGEKQRNVEILVRNQTHPLGRYLSVNATPLTDDQGRHRGGVAVFRDVTKAREVTDELKSEQHLLRRILDIQEAERKLVAHEIHDGLAQDIVGAQMHLESARHQLPTRLEDSAELLDQASHLLQKAIAEARRMINGLRPLIIDDEGMVAAIKHLIADQESETELEFRFEYDEHIDRMDPRLEGTVFRIVQEAINNVKQHSHSPDARIELRHQRKSLTLMVCDSGIGFDPTEVPQDRFGLRSIRERARLMGGQTMIESSPGGGTSIRVTFPQESLS